MLESRENVKNLTMNYLFREDYTQAVSMLSAQGRGWWPCIGTFAMMLPRRIVVTKQILLWNLLQIMGTLSFIS